MKAPANCAAMYFAPSLESIRLVAMKPIVTAGLMCAPEMFIVAVTMTERMIPWAAATARRSPPTTQIEPAPMNVKANVAIPSAYNLACVSLHIWSLWILDSDRTHRNASKNNAGRQRGRGWKMQNQCTPERAMIQPNKPMIGYEASATVAPIPIAFPPLAAKP